MGTRDQPMDAAADLLWERGYSATRPTMIHKRAGAGQSSMYHHFTGKAGLAAEATHRNAERMRQEVLDAAAGGGSAIAAMHAYLDMERRPLAGCRLGRLVQDPEVVEHDELRLAAAEFFGWLRRWLGEVLAGGQRSGELRPDFEPGEVAAFVAATVQGGYVLARAEADPAGFRPRGRRRDACDP